MPQFVKTPDKSTRKGQMAQREQRQQGVGISDADTDVAIWKSASAHQEVRIRTNKLHVTATEVAESRSLTVFSVAWRMAGLYNCLGKQLGVIRKRHVHTQKFHNLEPLLRNFRICTPGDMFQNVLESIQQKQRGKWPKAPGWAWDHPQPLAAQQTSHPT